ncbi:MAG: TolC family protein, partial [Daejeonella sp.]
YEGERRFDLVVRLDSAYRTDITDVRNLYVNTPSGQQVPLGEVAAISYKPGPVQIQRDNAKRRITIGFNVRNRDVQSIVNDIQQIIESKMKLPAGYYVTYGGQFQNLKEANQRLAIAVPVSLLLILLLLYFTFGSVKQSLLIFTAIPLSAIGGVFALLIRGMPFSISAGVGFIALFGVAVLNGIVLIAEFNRLAKEGVDDIHERVLKGTRVRLRPVLMTAAVASLGFLPMALSATSGAEVQRPLATVVIGGLLTATLLTLIVLPVLYIYFTESKVKRKAKPITVITAFILFGTLLFPTYQVQAQDINQSELRKLTLKQAIDEALRNNNSIRIAQYQTDLQQTLKRGSITIPKADLYYTQGVVSNPTIQDNLFNITQRLDFPTLYSSQSKLASTKIGSSERYKVIKENDLIADVKSAYLQYVYVIEKRKLLLHQDSIYSNLDRSSTQRYQTGESTKLESVTSSAQSMQIKNKIEQNTSDSEIAKKQLQTLLNTQDNIMVADSELVPNKAVMPVDSNSLTQSPLIQYLKQELKVNEQQTKVERNKMLPEIILGYNSQTYKGLQNINGINRQFTGSDRFSFYQFGLAIPIFPGGYRSQINAAKINEQIAQSQIALTKTTLQGELQKLVQEYYKLQKTLTYYQNQALPQAKLIIDNSEKGFKSGDISYMQHFQNLTLAINIQSDYLGNLYQYNQSVISIETLLGTK